MYPPKIEMKELFNEEQKKFCYENIDNIF